ncbi:M20/M25/M40 family metallo-hydrolase [Myroides sp. LJL119]
MTNIKIKFRKLIGNGFLVVSLLPGVVALAQEKDPIIQAIVKEATENSNLEQYAFELLDVIGPRLVGSPEMLQAHNWVVDKYTQLGVDAYNEQYGTWKGWQRGTTSVTLSSPRVKSLEAIQLAWSPSTVKQGVHGQVVVLPYVNNPQEFKEWLETIKGKFVMISKVYESGRPLKQWKEFATESSYQRMLDQRQGVDKNWNERIQNSGYSLSELPMILQEAGASGILMSYWTGVIGSNRIFSATTTKIPTIDLSFEDYSLLYRLAEKGKKPTIDVKVQNTDLGIVPTYNTIAEFKGNELKDQYVVLSAHLDSWDGGTGATDNGTGIITMLEVMRILKKVLPSPKRTILVGNWGSEEQGLNGSRAFVEDHPEILDDIQVVLNQDAGTGRIDYLPGEGFLHSYEYLSDWLANVPLEYKTDLKTEFPALPSVSGSDHAAFVSHGVPAFFLNSLEWGYDDYTWHTNRDTADKIVYDDLKSNVILIAIMAYKASEQQAQGSRERIVLPKNSKGEQVFWPTSKQGKREF